MLCSRCGRTIHDGVKFCPFCGMAFAADPPADAPTMAAAAQPAPTVPQAQPYQPPMPEQPPYPQAAPQPQYRPPVQAQPYQPQEQAPYAPAYPQPAQGQPQYQPAQTPTVKPKANPAKIVAIILVVIAVLAAVFFAVWYFSDSKDDKGGKTGGKNESSSMDRAIEICVDALNRGDKKIPDSIYPGDDFVFAAILALTDDELTESDLKEYGAEYLKSYLTPTLYPAFGRNFGGALDAHNYTQITPEDASLKGRTVSFDGKSFHIDDVRGIRVKGSPGVDLELMQIDGEWKVLSAFEFPATTGGSTYDSGRDPTSDDVIDDGYDWDDFDWDDFDLDDFGVNL